VGPDWGWLLIEAKFGSPTTTYEETPERVGEWIERYCDFAPELLDREGLAQVAGKEFPEQVLRNLVFAHRLQGAGQNAVVMALVRERERALAENLVRRCHDCQAAYCSAAPAVRKLFNQAFFKKLYIDDESHVRSELAAPFDVLLSSDLRVGAARAAKAQKAAEMNGRQAQAAVNQNTLGRTLLEGVRQIWTEVVGLKENQLVGAAGIEPATSRV
jgi:hypothetical protein